MDLHCERVAPTGGTNRARARRRLVLVHGFGQTGRCWEPVASQLARDHDVWTVDAPGHGSSPPVETDLAGGARLIADAGGRATYVGYSMGARYALHVAVHRPEVVERLVLIGGTAGIEDAAERAGRRERDRAMAGHIREVGVEAFLASWFDQPLFATLPDDARFMDERRRNTADGLARSLELAGTGAQRPLWAALPDLAVPVLAVAGQLDERYATIAHRMAEAVGASGQAGILPGAGHAAHLERPAEFVRLLRTWLDTDTSGRPADAT